MAEPKHKLRKLNVQQVRTFDEQLWPIDTALVVLGLLLAGIVSVVLRFDDPRVERNALTWLPIIPVVIGILMWLARQIDRRVVRRATLLATTLSIIVNMIFLVLLARAYISFQQTPAQSPVVAEQKPEPTVTISEYAFQTFEQQDLVRKLFEKPVETGKPDEADTQLARSVESTESPTAERADVSPEPLDSVSEQRRLSRREAESAPKRHDHASQLSRAERRTSQPPAISSLAETVTDSPSPQRPSVVASEAPSVPRTQADTTAVIARSDESTPTTESTADAPRLARRANEVTPKLETASRPELPRRTELVRALPRALAVDGQIEAAAQMTDAEAMTPQIVSTRKQATATIDSNRINAAPEDSASQVARRPVRRQQPADHTLAMAQTPEPAVGKTKAVSAPPTAELADAPRPPSDSSVAEQQAPRAASTQLAKSDATNPEQTTETKTTAENPFDRNVSTLAQSSMRRAQRSESPTIRPLANPDDYPSRVRRESQVAVSPQAVSSPASSESTRPTENPTALPARTALTQASGGVAGLGSAPNMDRNAPSSETTVDIASASARRARAVQRLEVGPAMSPSDPAQLSRSMADRKNPSVSARATPMNAPILAGTDQPQRLDANSSAALTRAASNAPSGMVTASRGDTEVDFGPTRIASAQGAGRASGGGRIVVNRDTQARMIARSETGGAPQISITAPSESPEAAAPVGAGGGQPLAPQAARIASRSGGIPSTSATRSSNELDSTDDDSLVGQVANASLTRAPAIDATEGPSASGGGSTETTRAARSAALLVESKAEMITVQGGSESSGEPRNQPLVAAGANLARSSIGLAGLATPQPTGSVPGPEIADGLHANSDEGGLARISRSSSRSGEVPMIASNSGADFRRADRTVVPPTGSSESEVEVPVVSPSDLRMVSSDNSFDGGRDSGTIQKSQFGSLPVVASARIGPGGFGEEPTPEAGLLQRQSQADSQWLQPSQARFVRSQIGGPLDFESSVEVIPADAFQRRQQRLGDPDGGGLGQLSPKTEESIELGLVFLTRYQNPNGSWTLRGYLGHNPKHRQEAAAMSSESAATGMALLAYLGAGYHHKDFKYREVVRNGLQSLIGNQAADGNLYVASGSEENRAAALYSHAIATIALCEAYGMTQDPVLKNSAQRAVQYIVGSQDPTKGGWRYTPGKGADTSVTGWMMMALKSAELANLKVDPRAFFLIQQWLAVAQASDSQPHLYRYNPFAPNTAETRHGRRASKTMTAVGLLMRLYSGWKPGGRRMQDGAQYLSEHLPSNGTRKSLERDTYYWYYATQVMFHMGDSHWESWNDALHPLLVDSQVREGPLAGSWNPLQPVPDRWGRHGGRLYVTALNLLSLEVVYRHLPIYDESKTVKDSE